MKTKFVMLLLGTISLLVTSCTQEISDEIQNDQSITTELSDVERFQNKAIRLTVDTETLGVNSEDDDVTYLLHKQGSLNEACEVTAPALGFNSTDYSKSDENYAIDCILEVQEHDLHEKGVALKLDVDQYLCEYVGYTPFRFLQYQPGKTAKYQYNVSCDSICAEEQPDLCDTLESSTYESFTGTVGSNLTVTDTTNILGGTQILNNAIASADGLTCDFDYTDEDEDLSGPNCDEGTIITVNYELQGVDEDTTIGEFCTLGEVKDTAGTYRNTEANCEATYTWDAGTCIDTSTGAPDETAAADAAGDSNGVVSETECRDYARSLSPPGTPYYVTTNSNPICYVNPEGDPGASGVDMNEIVCNNKTDRIWVGYCDNTDYLSASTCIAGGSRWNGGYCYADATKTTRQSCSGTWSEFTCNSSNGVDATAHNTEALCTASGVWGFQQSCRGGASFDDITLDYVDQLEEDCGGDAFACINGPAVDLNESGYDPKKHVSIIYENSDTTSFTQDFTIESPRSKGHSSNMYAASFSRICSDTSTAKSDSDFDSTLLLLKGDEVEELSPFETYGSNGGKAHDTNGDGVTDVYYYADHPFRGRAYYNNPRFTTYPYYSFRCLDKAQDTKAQIRLHVRDWDRQFGDSNAYIMRLSDINQTTPLMDTDTDQEVGSPWNDYKDWDDLFYDVDYNNLSDYDGDGDDLDNLFHQNKCVDVRIGTCYDASSSATADDNQEDCEATAGQYWISDDVIFPGLSL